MRAAMAAELTSIPSSMFRSWAGAATGDKALARYDDNRNGMITCKEARRQWFLRLAWTQARETEAKTLGRPKGELSHGLEQKTGNDV